MVKLVYHYKRLSELDKSSIGSIDSGLLSINKDTCAGFIQRDK